MVQDEELYGQIGLSDSHDSQVNSANSATLPYFLHQSLFSLSQHKNIGNRKSSSFIHRNASAFYMQKEHFIKGKQNFLSSLQCRKQEKKPHGICHRVANLTLMIATLKNHNLFFALPVRRAKNPTPPERQSKKTSTNNPQTILFGM